jgi:hypothetical protein
MDGEYPINLFITPVKLLAPWKLDVKPCNRVNGDAKVEFPFMVQVKLLAIPIRPPLNVLLPFITALRLSTRLRFEVKEPPPSARIEKLKSRFKLELNDEPPVILVLNDAIRLMTLPKLPAPCILALKPRSGFIAPVKLLVPVIAHDKLLAIPISPPLKLLLPVIVALSGLRADKLVLNELPPCMVAAKAFIALRLPAKTPPPVMLGLNPRSGFIAAPKLLAPWLAIARS